MYFCNEFTNKMTNKYEELVLAFESKLRKLISEYQTLQEQNNKLKADLERKHNDLMHAHQEVLEVRKNYNHLRTSLNLGVSMKNDSNQKSELTKWCGR